MTILLTFSNSTPTPEKHDAACEKVLLGFNTPCLVSLPPTDNENEARKLDLKMAVICDTDTCDLKFRVIHEAELFLCPETKEIYSFDREEAEIFSFSVPAQFMRILFTVTFKNMGQSIYESKPNQPEEVLYFTSGEPQIIKNNHQVVAIFNKSDSKLCSECNVTFYMTARVGMVIELEVFYYNATMTTLKLGHEYYDYTLGLGPQLYEIDVPEDQIPTPYGSEKLFFVMNSITGSEKVLYLNGDSNPYLLEAFRWNSTVKQYFEEEDIILTKAELDNAGVSGKKFFMAVKSNRPGLYKMEAKSFIAPYIKLSFGVTENAVVKYMNIDYYELELWKSEVNEDVIEVKLINERGNADLYGRTCRFDSSCELITNQDIQDKKSIDFFSETEGNDQIKLEPKCPLDHAYCYVLIAVRGYSLTTSMNKYSLTVSRRNGIVNLLENKNHESHVDFSSLTRFKLILDNPHNDIEKITIKVTADLPMAVSKNNECADYSKSCDIKFGDTRHPVIFTPEDGTFAGVYYISITGVKSTNFFIMPMVHRKNKPKAPIRLSEGKIYHDALNNQSFYEYFTFHLTIETLTNVDIIIQGARNRLQIFVCDDEKLPNENHFNWESTTNFLRIPLSVEREQGAYEKIFLVRVQALNNDDITVNNRTIDFEITYATDHTIKTLEKNRIFHDAVKEKFFRFYMLFVDNMDQKVAFVSHILNPSHLSKSLKMYVSSNPFPHYFTYNETTFTDSETEKLLLTRKNLDTLCGEKNMHCPIYLSVQNIDETHEITFSLMVEVADLAVELKEGFEQKLVITEPSFRAYYLPSHKDQEIDIFAYTTRESFELYINVYKDDQHLVNTPGFESHYPGKGNAQYTSSLSSRHTVNVKTKLVQDCWPDCVVLIGMQFPKGADYAAGFPVLVLISDDLVEFQEGKPLVFTLENFRVRYFAYDLMDLYKSTDDRSSILVTLTPFYGYAHIYLAVSVNGQSLRPNLKSYEFKAYSDHIQLNRSEVMRGIHIPEGKSLKVLKLIICVYGVSDGKFMLSVFSEKQLTPHLFTGMPQEILLAGGYKLTMQYFNTNNDVLRLSFNRESGLGSIQITPCNPQIESENTFEKCLQKTSTYYSIITGSGSSLIRLSEASDEDYCKTCVYLVQMKAVSDLKGSLLVSHPESLISLQEGRKILDGIEANEKNRYALYMQDFREFEIIMSVYSGKPEICFSYNYLTEATGCAFKSSKHADNGLISFTVPPRNYIKPDENSGTMAGDVRLHFNTFYILVTSPTKADYSLTYLQSNGQILQSGVVSYDSLPAGSFKSYIHRYYDLDASPHITLSCLENCHLSELSLSAKYRPLSAYTANDVRVVHLDIEPLFKTNTTASYKLPKERASFEFIVENLAKHSLNYSLAINGRDVAVLPYDFNYQGVLEGKHSRYYEVYVPKKGHLVLELMDCFGEVQILVSRSYEKVIKEEFDEEFKPLKDQPFVHLLKVNKGMIYLAVNNVQAIAAAYEFNIHFYETYLEIPQTRLSGEMLHYYMDESKLQMVIRPISCEDCTAKELTSTNITYYAMVAENQTVLNIAGKCGLTMMPHSGIDIQASEFFREKALSHKLIESNNTENMILTVDIKAKGKVYYATVKAVIDYLGEKKIVNYYYPTIEIYVSQKFVESKWFILVMGLFSLAVFVGCCLFGVHFYGKYKRIEKKLLYEMDDPKNMTQVSGVNLYEPQNVSSIEMESKTYQGLN